MGWLQSKYRSGSLLLGIAGVFFTTLWYCSPGDSNGSGVGNGMICGKLYAPDGKTPASGAEVGIWDKDVLAQISKGNRQQSINPVVVTQTDNDGFYRIDTIDPGTYLIEAVDRQKNMARIDSVDIESPTAKLELPPDTLKAPGAIRGKVVLEYGGDLTQTHITCLWAKKMITVINADGSFLIDELAEEVYNLTVSPGSLGQYAPHQVGAIKVKSGDTVNLETITLSGFDIPAVSGLAINYDSAGHTAIIRWMPIIPSVAIGYHVYRRGAGDSSFGSALNGSEPVRGTSYADSSAFRGSTFEYCVAVVDSNKKLGPKSSIVTTATRMVQLTSDMFDFVVTEPHPDCLFYPVDSKAGNSAFFMVFYTDSLCAEAMCPTLIELQKYSSNGQLVYSKRLSEQSGNGGRIVDERERLFFNGVKDTDTGFIGCVDETGSERVVMTYGSVSLKGYDVAGNNLVVATGLHRVDREKLIGPYSCRISVYAIAEKTLVFTKEIVVDPDWDIVDARIGADGTVRILFNSAFSAQRMSCYDECAMAYFYRRIDVLSASGSVVSSNSLMCSAGSSFGWSGDSYVVGEALTGTDKIRYTWFDYQNVQLFGLDVPENTSCYMTFNGDMFSKTSNADLQKATIRRLKKPLEMRW